MSKNIAYLYCEILYLSALISTYWYHMLWQLWQFFCQSCLFKSYFDGHTLDHAVGTGDMSCWQVYKKQASDMDYDECHLFLRPVQFEFAPFKEDAGKPPPLLITSVQEDDSMMDRYCVVFWDSVLFHGADELLKCISVCWFAILSIVCLQDMRFDQWLHIIVYLSLLLFKNVLV